MFVFHGVDRAAQQRRRRAIRALHPFLGSTRLVELFAVIGEIAVTRPELVPSLEIMVGRMTKPRPARAQLPLTARARASRQ